MSLTRPLTRPLTRKISRADLTQGFGGSFSPFALNPYLLFDARDSMVGTLENPTLDLNPALPETLDVITATRAGTATFTDANGNIATAPANTVRVDYTQGAELTPTKFQRVAYTDFSLGWQSLNNLAVTSSGDFQGQPVFRLTTDGVSANSIYQDTIATEEGFTYTGSFYIRRISGSTQPYVRHGASASGNSTAIAVTTEWTRVSVPILSKSGGGFVYFGFIQSLAGNDVYEITQPQFEEGTTASDFVANTTGSPKFITGATFGPRVPMILVEPSSENLLVESNAFFNSADATKTTGIDAPDGTNTAINIGNILAGTSDRANSSYAIVTGSTDYSGSVYVRGNAGDVVALYIKRVAGSFVSSPIRHVTLTGDWQRVENINITTLADNTQLRLFVYKDNSVTADSVDLWGGQIELGSVSTSVIPTSGSTVTRAADDLVITGSAFTDFYNQSEGTFYAESNTRLSDGQPFIVSVDNGDNNRIILYNATTSVRGFVKTSGSTQADFSISTRPSANTLNRIALSYKTNNVQGSLNGGSVITDTSVSIATSINRMNIGTRYNQGDANKLNGHLKRLIYWPYHSDSL